MEKKFKSTDELLPLKAEYRETNMEILLHNDKYTEIFLRHFEAIELRDWLIQLNLESL